MLHAFKTAWQIAYTNNPLLFAAPVVLMLAGYVANQSFLGQASQYLPISASVVTAGIIAWQADHNFDKQASQNPSLAAKRGGIFLALVFTAMVAGTLLLVLTESGNTTFTFNWPAVMEYSAAAAGNYQKALLHGALAIYTLAIANTALSLTTEWIFPRERDLERFGRSAAKSEVPQD